MYRKKKIGVSIPCYNEENFIDKTLSALPEYVDKVYVTDDGSTDHTQQVIKKFVKKDPRIVLLVNTPNMGNGYSVVNGFKHAIKDNCDIACIVAGDNQYPTEYLSNLIDGVIDEKYDYVKGNRFFHKRELEQMPRFRKIGNVVMSIISKFASGYYSISDPLNSFSAININILKRMNLNDISHRYDFENSFLLHMYLNDATIKDIPVPAKYEGEESNIVLRTYVVYTSKTLIKSFFTRISQKYIVFSFHPVGLFLISGLTLFLFGLIYGVFIVLKSIGPQTASTATVMLSIVPFIVGFQLLLQAIVLDIQNEPGKEK